MKKILILLSFLMISFSAYAQNVVEKSPKKGSFTVGLLLGRGHYINTGLTLTKPVSGEAPYFNSIDANDNNFANMVGLEGKYFVTDNIAVSLRGGAIFRHTPDRVNIPAVPGAEGSQPVIPAYESVKGEDNTEIHIEPGAEWYFQLKSKRLNPYVGVSIPFNYARHTLLDPTVKVEDGKATQYSYGPATADLFGIGLQGNAGLDYFLTKEMFIGFDVKPISVQYVFSGKKPQPGTILRESQNVTYSFFGQFSFKLGFVLN